MSPLQLSLTLGFLHTVVKEISSKHHNINSQVILIESFCTTHRAAALLKISSSTLYRTRSANKEYKKANQNGIWIAQPVEANSWKVLFQNKA